jgi:malonyl-CoA O-methyltransferase
MSSESQLARKASVMRRFSGSAHTYDAHAALQKSVAATLASLLPERGMRTILELGCGTGLFTARLLECYPGSRFLFTDISPEMVSHCMGKFGPAPNRAFKAMDGDGPIADGPFDLIASSMALQWFQDPVASIGRQREKLSAPGALVFATLGPDNFPEWRQTLEQLGEDVGLLPMPRLPGVFIEERIRVDYRTAQNFLAMLRATGADQPRAGYRPLGSLPLRRACDALNRAFAGCVTWHIVYGCIGA